MENGYQFPIKDVGVPNNKLDNQTLLGSFSIISNSSVFTDIRNEFAYTSRFRNDMRALFIELHVLHRSYKSQEKGCVKEQKKKEAASSTNIEDDINDNRNNQISTKIDAVADADANTDEKKGIQQTTLIMETITMIVKTTKSAQKLLPTLTPSLTPSLSQILMIKVTQI
jgi:hypothetical protein